MKIAIIYSFLAGFSLILGVIIGMVFKISQRVIAAIMAFGSGVLICALTFGLMEEAFKHGGFDAIVIGFLVGGVVFIGGDFLVHRYGGRNYKKRSTPELLGILMEKQLFLAQLLMEYQNQLPWDCHF